MLTITKVSYIIVNKQWSNYKMFGKKQLIKDLNRKIDKMQDDLHKAWDEKYALSKELETKKNEIKLETKKYYLVDYLSVFPDKPLGANKVTESTISPYQQTYYYTPITYPIKVFVYKITPRGYALLRFIKENDKGELRPTVRWWKIDNAKILDVFTDDEEN